MPCYLSPTFLVICLRCFLSADTVPHHRGSQGGDSQPGGCGRQILGHHHRRRQSGETSFELRYIKQKYFEDNILRPDSQHHQYWRDDLGPVSRGPTVRMEILQGGQDKAVIESFVYLILTNTKCLYGTPITLNQ